MADGFAGGISTSVGVGTGGSVNVGGGLGGPASPVGPDGLVPGAEGAAEPGGGALTCGPSGTGEDGLTGCEASSLGVTRSAVAGADGGAAPIPPAPLGALAVGWSGAGGPSSQPIVIATGSPNATMPKKTVLGESRTQRTRARGAKRLRVEEARDPGAQFAPVVPEHRGPVVDVQPGIREQGGEAFRDRSRMKVVA